MHNLHDSNSFDSCFYEKLCPNKGWSTTQRRIIANLLTTNLNYLCSYLDGNAVTRYYKSSLKPSWTKTKEGFLMYMISPPPPTLYMRKAKLEGVR